MNWGGTRVLVTGADGFVGSHLCEALVRAGAEVTAFVKHSSRIATSELEYLRNLRDIEDSITVLIGDILEYSSVLHAVREKDVIYHLAAQTNVPLSRKIPMETFKVNALGSLNVLEAVRQEGCARAVVFMSSDKVYGDPCSLPITEDHTFFANSPYDASKIAADQLFLSYHRSYDLPAVVLRCSNVYGPRQSLEKVLPSFICQALRDKSIRLRYWPNNKQPKRDFIFITDVISALILAVEKIDKCIGIPVNIGTAVSTDIEQLARTILKHVDGVIKPFVLKTTPKEIFEERLEYRRARELLGWQPQISLEDGIRRTFEWYRNNPWCCSAAKE